MHSYGENLSLDTAYKMGLYRECFAIAPIMLCFHPDMRMELEQLSTPDEIADIYSPLLQMVQVCNVTLYSNLHHFSLAL
jgi:hypothetical protein